MSLTHRPNTPGRKLKEQKKNILSERNYQQKMNIRKAYAAEKLISFY